MPTKLIGPSQVPVKHRRHGGSRHTATITCGDASAATKLVEELRRRGNFLLVESSGSSVCVDYRGDDGKANVDEVIAMCLKACLPVDNEVAA